MRENWDYVSMDTYSADMAELAGTASNALTYLQRENLDLKRLIWHLVHAAGGTLSVCERDLARHEDSHHELTQWRNDADMSLTFEAKFINN